MKPGDFVDVHFPDGCKIGRFVSNEGDTVSVEFGTITGENVVMQEIPKNKVTLYFSLDDEMC